MFWNKDKQPSDANPELHPELMEALASVDDPELHQDLVALGMIKRAALSGSDAQITVELTTPACPLKDTIKRDIAAAVEARLPGTSVAIEWTARTRAGRHGGSMKAAQALPSLEQVRNVILVASGKGGVGKSTVASNLAAALARSGAEVGLMDADIYGPSVPTMMGMHDEVTSTDGKTIDPHVVGGIKLMSMGFFIPPEKAMIWRGPMLHSAVLQFLKDVRWGELDYLVVDLPPGTGDVQLTFAQQIRVTGAVIVSTPQDVALADVVRAKAMFDTVDIPVLGLIENMSYFVCDGCEKKHHLFAHGGAKKAAETLDIAFLGELPLEIGVREAGDRGRPIVAAEPETPIAQTFIQIARTIAGKVSVLNIQRPAEPTPAPSATGNRRLPVLG